MSLHPEASKDNGEESSNDPSEEQKQGEKEVSNDDPDTEKEEELDEGSDVLDEDELDMIHQLKERIHGAKSELEEDVGDELDSFAKRVNDVVDSVNRIESIDSKRPEDILYEKGDKEKADSSAKMGKDGDLVPGDFEEEKKSDLIGDEQLSVSSASPYTEIKKIIESATPIQSTTDTYETDTDSLVSSMMKLANLKEERGKKKEAFELLTMLRDLKPDDPDLAKRIEEIGEGVYVAEIDERPNEIDLGVVQGKTKVLVPELEDEISILEKRASSALKQAEILMKSNSLPQDRFDEFSNKLIDAKKLFNEKRFHRSHEISLEIIEQLRGIIKENIDKQTQKNIDRSREMLEDIKGGDFDIPEETMEGIKEDFDKAVKSYLTNDFERANLLSKKVISKIRKFNEPEGLELRKDISRIKGDMRDVSDPSLLGDQFSELNKLLATSEDLIEKRDYEGAKRVVSRAEDTLSEIKTSKQLYYTAKEIQIRLNNRIERFDSVDVDITDIKRKLEYLNKMFDQERYEDVITLGGDIETSIGGLEVSRKEKEAKRKITVL